MADEDSKSLTKVRISQVSSTIQALGRIENQDMVIAKV